MINYIKNKYHFFLNIKKSHQNSSKSWNKIYIIIQYKFDQQIEDIIIIMKIKMNNIFNIYHFITWNELNDLDKFIYEYEKYILIIWEW